MCAKHLFMQADGERMKTSDTWQTHIPESMQSNVFVQIRLFMTKKKRFVSLMAEQIIV